MSAFLSLYQVLAMPPSWSFLCLTSTTLWSWPGACTTCSSAFSQSSPGQAATTSGTQKTVLRILSAGTRHSGQLRTPLTSLPPSLSSGSKYLLIKYTFVSHPKHLWSYEPKTLPHLFIQLSSITSNNFGAHTLLLTFSDLIPILLRCVML